MVEPMRMVTDRAICHEATSPMAILVNIAIGEVKGMKEQATISRLSTLPADIENMTIMKAIMQRNVTGIITVESSSILLTRLAREAYRKAYKRKPNTKNKRLYSSMDKGMANMDWIIATSV